MIEGERKLATIRRIADIEPIEGADRIVCATIDGWKLVTQKGNYAPGDLCIYFEIDSFLPVREEFEFLRKGSFKNHPELGEGFRIKTIKLRGQVSQGLSLPLKDFFEVNDDGSYYMPDSGNIHLYEGMDVTDYFGVQKYEKPETGPGGNKFGPSSARGNFPSFIPKTDQERIQNCWGSIKKFINFAGSEVVEVTDENYIALLETGEVPSSFGLSYFKNGDLWFKRTMIPNDDETIEKRMTFEVTTKLDGSSMTVYHNEGQIGVCSRNLDLKRDPENLFWATAINSQILMPLVQVGRNVAIQGELMGPGVQGNRENLTTNRFFVFDVYDIDLQRYMIPGERNAYIVDVFSYIDSNGGINNFIGTIPEPYWVFNVTTDLEVSDFLKMADEQKSINHAVAEGLVFKSHEPEGPTFKVISNKYLLAEKD